MPAIVLAAGLSTRLEQNKLLLPLQDKQLLHWVLDALIAARLEQIVVVTGHEARLVEDSCAGYAGRVSFCFNADYAAGRATSIKAGLAALPAQAAAVLITPADVPLISPELINRLLSEYRASGRITFPTYQGRKGHPVIFPAASFPLLRALSKDQTLHDYLLSHQEQTCVVDWDDPGCIADVDDNDDLIRLSGG